MTWSEFLEWQAYFRLQEKDRKRKKKPPKNSASTMNIMGALQGYQNRRDENRRRP